MAVNGARWRVRGKLQSNTHVKNACHSLIKSFVSTSDINMKGALFSTEETRVVNKWEALTPNNEDNLYTYKLYIPTRTIFPPFLPFKGW